MCYLKTYWEAYDDCKSYIKVLHLKNEVWEIKKLLLETAKKNYYKIGHKILKNNINFSSEING